MEKIYLNTGESNIYYRFQDFKFYFSSLATRERFIRKLENYINEERLKFNIKYDVESDEDSFNLMYAFILYKKTEKRGFKVYYETKQLIKFPTFKIYLEVGE